MISCRFDRPSRARAVLDVIKGQADWTQLDHSLYLVSTDQTAEQLYADMTRFTELDDSLYVLTVSHPYRGFGQRQVNQWLDKRLA